MHPVARVCALLEAAGSEEPPMPPTLLYNEGWLLRLALDAEARGTPCLPFRFAPGARWFSEALLYSAFLPRRRGDPLAESCTHADAVVGQIAIHPQSKAGVLPAPAATQFRVLEAKMFSPLSAGTTRAPGFDQAARNVACIAETLRRAGRPLPEYTSLGFHLLAPADRIAAGAFRAEMDRASIRAKIAARISAYEGASRERLDGWFRGWVEPLLERLEIGAAAWEDVLAPLGSEYARFYRRCLKFNAPALAASAAG